MKEEQTEEENRRVNGIARNKEDKEKTVDFLMKAYESLPMQVVEGTGGWVSKRDLLNMYGELANYRSYATFNQHYGEVKDCFVETRKGVLKFARPHTQWKLHMSTIKARRLTEMNSFITLIRDTTKINDVVNALYDNIVTHEDYFPSSVYSGMGEDILSMIHRLVTKLEKCAELITFKEE